VGDEGTGKGEDDEGDGRRRMMKEIWKKEDEHGRRIFHSSSLFHVLLSTLPFPCSLCHDIHFPMFFYHPPFCFLLPLSSNFLYLPRIFPSHLLHNDGKGRGKALCCGFI
jgi:hypothetical protein